MKRGSKRLTSSRGCGGKREHVASLAASQRPPSWSFQIKVWTANPQQFVEDEDDDTFSYTVRIAAQDLLLVRAAQRGQQLGGLQLSSSPLGETPAEQAVGGQLCPRRPGNEGASPMKLEGQ